MKSLLTARERRVVALLALLVASGYGLLGLGFEKSKTLSCDLDSLDALISLRGAALWADSSSTTAETNLRLKHAGPVDINTASYGELLSLQGIGPSRARSILELRQKRGRFRSCDDLLKIHGIGAGTLRRISDRIHLGVMCPDSADSMTLLGQDK